MISPGDELNNALLKYLCYQSDNSSEKDTNHLFSSESSIEDFLPEDLHGQVQKLKQLPLYELTESLIKLFGLGNRVEDLPYLQAFQELIIDLHRKEPLGISDFLDYWDQHGAKKSISVSEESNAIRILTIHKAKGLEFNAVLIPFCNWEITTDQRKSNILWCDTKGTPFQGIPVVPVRFSSKMEHTLFSSAYYEERMKGYLDSLNLMYVAFTRARDILYVGIPGGEQEKLKDIGGLIHAILNGVPEKGPSLDTLETYRTGNQIIIGNPPSFTQKAHVEEPWQFNSYPVNQGNRSLSVRMRSDEYFVDEEGAFRTGQMYGNVMHLLFSRISSPGDVDPVLISLQREGLLPNEERLKLQEILREIIARPGVDQWFSDGKKRVIYNERNIYCADGTIIRPDRVIDEGGHVTVVDFKFGEVEKRSYHKQVRMYMTHLEQMGYKSVKGYVWYVMLNKSVKIELK